MSTIDRLPPVPGFSPPRIETPRRTPGAGATESFGDTLKQFVSEVNEMQQVAGEKTLKFATGELRDLHEVMAAAEEAGISMMLLLEIRNKALDAYKELMRTPV